VYSAVSTLASQEHLSTGLLLANITTVSKIPLKVDATTDIHKTSVVSGSQLILTPLSVVHIAGTKILRTEIVVRANQFPPSMFIFLHFLISPSPPLLRKCTSPSHAPHPMKMFQEADKELSVYLKPLQAGKHN